jgi:hypothetical protein
MWSSRNVLRSAAVVWLLAHVTFVPRAATGDDPLGTVIILIIILNPVVSPRPERPHRSPLKTLVQGLGECSKAIGLAARQLLEMLHSPPNRREFGEMRDSKQRPVRLRAHERPQELALARVERCR